MRGMAALEQGQARHCRFQRAQKIKAPADRSAPGATSWR